MTPRKKQAEAEKPEAKKPEAEKPEAKKPEAKKPEAEKPQASEKDSDSSVPSEAVPVEIPTQESPPKKAGAFSKILNRANEVAGADPGEVSRVPVSKPKKRGRGRPRKNEGIQETQENFTNLVSSLIALAIAGINAPEEVKPNEEEVTTVTSHAMGILLRHFPINGKMGADTMDMIGIIAVVSGYYTRVAPLIRDRRQNPDSYSQQYNKWVETSGSDSPVDPIAQASPGTGDFLNRAHKKGLDRDKQE